MAIALLTVALTACSLGGKTVIDAESAQTTTEPAPAGELLPTTPTPPTTSKTPGAIEKSSDTVPPAEEDAGRETIGVSESVTIVIVDTGGDR